MITLLKSFFDNYITNKLEANQFSDHIEIDYSTLGKHKGIEDVLNALRLNGEYQYRYNIVSNEIDYLYDQYQVHICNAFHFLIKEKGSYNVESATSSIKGEIYPFVYGGKYKFYIRNDKIEKICFHLDAEFGNTYQAKKERNWKLFEETKNEFQVKLDKHSNSQLLTEKDRIAHCISCLFLLADTSSTDNVNDYITEDAVYSFRDSTYAGMGVGEDDRKIISISEFIKTNKDREDQNHHSYHMVDLSIDSNKAVALLDMFEPTKLGYKHLDAVTVYQPYYNERVTVRLEKEKEWKISEIDSKAISKFKIIGYTTLEI